MKNQSPPFCSQTPCGFQGQTLKTSPAQAAHAGTLAALGLHRSEEHGKADEARRISGFLLIVISIVIWIDTVLQTGNVVKETMMQSLGIVCGLFAVLASLFLVMQGCDLLKQDAGNLKPVEVDVGFQKWSSRPAYSFEDRWSWNIRGIYI